MLSGGDEADLQINQIYNIKKKFYSALQCKVSIHNNCSITTLDQVALATSVEYKLETTVVKEASVTLYR